MAPRRSAAAAAEAEEQEQEGELATLQFDEPLTWRPGKPIPIDQLLKRLDRLSKELAELDQETTDPGSLTHVAKDVASHQLLNHKDKGVRAYTACCVVDILRLCAPDAPFTPSQLKDVFNLAVISIIPALFDPSNPYNNQHKYVLRSLAEIKSIVLLLDVDGSEGLLLSLFSTIFDGVSGAKSASGEQVAKDVEFSMQELLGVLIDDATSLPAKVVDVIMAQFLRAAAPGAGKRDHVPIDDTQATLLAKEEPEAYQIAKHLCHEYPEKMARFVSQYFSDVIVDATSFAGRPNGHKDAEDEDDEDGPSGPSDSDLKELEKAHTLIREVWKAAPMILQNVVPQIDAELLADNVRLRQLATETLGDMISGIGASGPPPPPILDPAAYPPLRLEGQDRTEAPVNMLTTPLSAISFSQTHNATFHNFISRKNDKAPTIRAAWTTAVGHIVSTSAGGIGLGREDEATLVRALGEKLSDTDEKVRLAAVKAIESFGFHGVVTKLAPNGGVNKEDSVLSTLADRCRDRKPAVRVAAMALLGRLWAVGTGELLAGHSAVTAALDGVPSRILKAFYANDPELNVLLDRVIYECLVPLGYPPQKKSPKNTNANGSSQSQAAGATPLDQDAIRAERILLLVRSLTAEAKKAFFAMQARQPQFGHVLETFVKQCEQYNGGVMDDNAETKTAKLNQAAQYLAQFLPDPAKSKADLIKFAKNNERRNYNLIKFIVGQEHEFRTVHKALKELIKRVQSSKDPSILETLLPLLYRSGCFLFNRSHLSTIMEYSRSDKDGMGAVAHEMLNEISQRNPDLFKTHVGQLCKDLVDQAPSPSHENDPIVVETLKACSTYARKYPKDVPTDRNFVQTMINYALYGRPPRAAKYAVNILLSKKDDKSLVSATDLMQRVLKDWAFEKPHFLNKLAAVSQLELLAPKITAEHEDTILNMTVQQILLEVRKEETPRDPDWVDDADLDQECQAKCLALKTLANRLRSIEDVAEAKEKAKPVWKLFMKLIRNKGELCKTKDTPKHHRSRLRLTAAQLLLKLCTHKHFDEVLSAQDFDVLAFTTQDVVQEVRHGFVRTLQKYLADGKLRARYYTVMFLMAFEPNTEFKSRAETWIRSRARHFEANKQPVLEAIMARLLSLLAHHPDYSAELDDLVDHARYILFYVGLVATESNLGLIYKYAERVKQTQDTMDPSSDRHQVLSDLAQAVVRKWQEKKNWAFIAHPSKVGLPMGLYTALKSHEEAQAIAEKQLVPEGIDERLDELLKALDKKKNKRKSTHDGTGDGSTSNPPAKRSRVQPKSVLVTSELPREAKPASKSTSKKASTSSGKPKKVVKPAKKKKETSSPSVPERDRRRSGRSRANQSYIERDSSEDDEEMLDGVAEWEYEGESGQEEAGDGSGSEAGSGSEDEEAEEKDEEAEETEEEDEEKEAKTPNRRAPRGEKKAGKPAAAAPTDSGSELSEVEDVDMEDLGEQGSENEEEEEKEDDENDEEDTPPPSKATNGRSQRGAAKGKTSPAATAKGKGRGSAKAEKEKPTAVPVRSSGRVTRGGTRGE